jgi:DtxR family transcriptional regulator, Mn-dependent transcriptional regulator
MLTITEENYLKCIFKLSDKQHSSVSTNSIASFLGTAPASVTDMLKKLADKNFIVYEKYKGVKLTSEGEEHAVRLIRRHRLWEVFLVEKLKFSWDKVHDIAEELEHINSSELVKKLDEFLGFPEVDPHGDPIPDANLIFKHRNEKTISELSPGDTGVIVGVRNSSSEFLQHLNKLNLILGSEVKVAEKMEFDGSIRVLINKNENVTISELVSNNIFVKEVS